MKIKKFIPFFKIKGFNFNRLVALLISSFIIICLKYYFNYFGYTSDLSFIFIFFCGLLKSITIITIESTREYNLSKNNKLNSIIFKN